MTDQQISYLALVVMGSTLIITLAMLSLFSILSRICDVIRAQQKTLESQQNIIIKFVDDDAGPPVNFYGVHFESNQESDNSIGTTERRKSEHADCTAAVREDQATS